MDAPAKSDAEKKGAVRVEERERLGNSCSSTPSDDRGRAALDGHALADNILVIPPASSAGTLSHKTQDESQPTHAQLPSVVLDSTHAHAESGGVGDGQEAANIPILITSTRGGGGGSGSSPAEFRLEAPPPQQDAGGFLRVSPQPSWGGGLNASSASVGSLSRGNSPFEIPLAIVSRSTTPHATPQAKAIGSDVPNEAAVGDEEDGGRQARRSERIAADQRAKAARNSARIVQWMSVIREETRNESSSNVSLPANLATDDYEWHEQHFVSVLAAAKTRHENERNEEDAGTTGEQEEINEDSRRLLFAVNATAEDIRDDADAEREPLLRHGSGELGSGQPPSTGGGDVSTKGGLRHFFECILPTTEGSKRRKKISKKRMYALSPFERFIKYRHIPYKFILHVLLVVLLTVQIYGYQQPENNSTDRQRYHLISEFMPPDFQTPRIDYIPRPIYYFSRISDVKAFINETVQKYYATTRESPADYHFRAVTDVSQSSSSSSGIPVEGLDNEDDEDAAAANRDSSSRFSRRQRRADKDSDLPESNAKRRPTSGRHTSGRRKKLRRNNAPFVESRYAWLPTDDGADTLLRERSRRSSSVFDDEPTGEPNTKQQKPAKPTSGFHLKRMRPAPLEAADSDLEKASEAQNVAAPKMIVRASLLSPRFSLAQSTSVKTQRVYDLFVDQPFGIFNNSENVGQGQQQQSHSSAAMPPLIHGNSHQKRLLATCTPRPEASPPVPSIFGSFLQGIQAEEEQLAYNPCRGVRDRAVFDTVDEVEITFSYLLEGYDSAVENDVSYIWHVTLFLDFRFGALVPVTISVMDSRWQRLRPNANIAITCILFIVSVLDLCLRIRSVVRIRRHRLAFQTRCLRKGLNPTAVDGGDISTSSTESEGDNGDTDGTDTIPRSPTKRNPSSLLGGSLATNKRPSEIYLSSPTKKTESQWPSGLGDPQTPTGAGPSERTYGAAAASGATPPSKKGAKSGNGKPISKSLRRVSTVLSRRRIKDKIEYRNWQERLKTSMGLGWAVFAIIGNSLTILYVILELTVLLPEYVSPSSTLAQWRDMVHGLAVMVCWTMLSMYTRYFPKVYFLIRAGSIVLPHMGYCLVASLPIFLGFTSWATVVYGAYNPQYHSFIETLSALYASFFGDSLLQSFQTSEASDNWWVVQSAKIFCFVFIALFMWVILNIALAIVVEAYEHVRGRFGLFDPGTAGKKVDLRSSSLLLHMHSNQRLKITALQEIYRRLAVLDDLNSSDSEAEE